MSKLSEAPSQKPPEILGEHSAVPLAAEFSTEQRRILLRIAHEAIASVLERRSFSVTAPSSPVLAEPRGVFTTLYLIRGFDNDAPGGLRPQRHRDLCLRELRGCVGYAAPVAPLYRAVAETARAAAFEDSRFVPVTLAEASQIEVSLSVLSPLFPIHPDAVEVGRHGLLISQGPRRGLLLPQVPVENDWDRETFLEQTCHKARLPADAWRKDATLEAFTAQVFSDADVEAR